MVGLSSNYRLDWRKFDLEKYFIDCVDFKSVMGVGYVSSRKGSFFD
jgi:hypothetical protein